MTGTLLEILVDNERSANRTCSIAVLIFALLGIALIIPGFFGFYRVNRLWMLYYLFAGILPMLAIALYAKMHRFQGGRIRHLMFLTGLLVPVVTAVPSGFGFFLMALPIVVAGRYLRPSFIWYAFGLTVFAAFLVTIPHAMFGNPLTWLDVSSTPTLAASSDWEIDRPAYWRYLLAWGIVPLVISLAFFAILLYRFCRDGWDVLESQSRMSRRLVDAERGLAIAAAQAMMMSMRRFASPVTAHAAGDATCRSNVGRLSTQAISECIAKCKRRAAEDPAFAALVEENPDAAIAEVLK